MNIKVAVVFGGSGFIGRHLVSKLAKTGAEVRIAVRDIEAAQYLKPAGDVGQIVPIQTNVSNFAHVAGALSGADTVINLVGILYKKGAQTFERIHVDAAKNIANASNDAGVKRLLHMSALGADPDSPAEYGRTKSAGEQAVLEIFKTATVFRPSVIFGPQDNFFNQFARMARTLPVMPVIGTPPVPKIQFTSLGRLKIDFFGKGGPRFQPVFVGDVAEAIVLALKKEESKGITYELGGPRAYSFKEIIELVLDATHRKRILIPLPLAIANAEAFFLQILPNPLLTTDQVNLMRSDNVVSGNAPGLNAFGIEPKAVEAILPTYLSRFRKSHHQSPRVL